MKKYVLTFGLTLICLSGIIAQLPTDSISIIYKKGMHKYYYGDMKLNMSKLVNIVGTNFAAYPEIKAAQSTQTLADVFAFAGGFIIGYQVADIFFGKDPNLILSGIAVVLIGTSFPIYKKAARQTIQAIGTYNNGFRTSSIENSGGLNVAMTQNGIGLLWTF
jgi:hypothetical protein